MSTFIYTVEIPAILHLILGFETKDFEDEKPINAREKALIYLSEVLIKATEREGIIFSEFENENSTKIKKIESLNQFPYLSENGILDFQKLSECEIRYSFNEYVLRDAFHNRNNSDDVLENYGFFKISARSSEIHHSRKDVILEIINKEQFSGFVREKRMLSKFFNTENIELKPLFSEEHYFIKSKINEMKELFLEKENLYHKEILNTDKFLEIEKIYLSFLNAFYLTKYLFVPKKEAKNSGISILRVLEKMYPSENKFQHYISVEIEGEKYEVFTLENVFSEELTHSKQGKLYIRNKNGATEVNEETTLSELFNIHYTNPEIEEIFKIL